MDAEVASVEVRARVHAALGDPARLAIVDALRVGDASPGEIAEQLGMATNLVAHHLKVLDGAGLVARTRSEGDRRRTYLRLRPDTLALLGPPHLTSDRVVFVCTRTRRPDQPGRRGGDARGRHRHHRADARKLDHATAESSDVLVSMGCGDACPVFPGKRYLDWDLDDPAGQGIDAVRRIRDDIRGRVETLVSELSAAR
ncbi:hypothetical protein GCM10009557_90710 [Virgisporangium ochraceum]|uniref:HTH arsR-type domain-containing protein n=1 Tax=Virgisporangium ochraceum TaxID=65505 RepID=A0A8J3ZVH9_9ACTN|nr:hypothetical protein Voc01_056410 [Virgisporangium ochraceum]